MSSFTPAASAARRPCGWPSPGPRPGVGRVVWRTNSVISQLDADGGQLGPNLVQIVHDQRAGIRVDGQPAVLVGLGVLTNAAAAANDVVERNVHQGAVQIDVTDLQAVQLTAADTGDHHQPQVQAQGQRRARGPRLSPRWRMRTSPSSASARNACRTVPGFSPWSSCSSGTDGRASGGAGGARTHDRRIMRSTAPCIVRTSCTDTTESCHRWL